MWNKAGGASDAPALVRIVVAVSLDGCPSPSTPDEGSESSVGGEQAVESGSDASVDAGSEAMDAMPKGSQRPRTARFPSPLDEPPNRGSHSPCHFVQRAAR